jgi:predicted RNA binding protein YcfA (HicA-like mRNA interferase family)
MTSGLPVVSGREAIRVFEQLSVWWQRGSHVRLQQPMRPIPRKAADDPNYRTERRESA